MKADGPGEAHGQRQSSCSVFLVVEQLRRAVPGGIGTYITGLLQGLSGLELAGDPRVTLYASAVAGPDPLEAQPFSIQKAALPSKVLTRLWRIGLGRVGSTQSLLHALSLAQPPTDSRLVVTVHDLAWRTVPVAFRQRRWHEHALAHARRKAALVVVPSQKVASELSLAGFSPQRIEVIEHGSDHLPAPDHEATSKVLVRLGVSGDFLLSVGTLEPRKNLARLFEAYREARPYLPEPWPLVVVGPAGWGPNLAPEKDVYFTGAVAKNVLSGLYARARLLAYVPFDEGYGLPVVEAMRAGTPVLSSSVPSSKGASYLVDPRDVLDLADGLVRLSSDEGLRAEHIAAGQAATRELTWTRSAARHVALWRELAPRR